MQKIVVLGGGESGVGSAILAKDKGFEVFLSDNGTITVEFKDMLLKYHINFEEGGHTFDKILQADASVLQARPSPPAALVWRPEEDPRRHPAFPPATQEVLSQTHTETGAQETPCPFHPQHTHTCPRCDERLPA